MVRRGRQALPAPGALLRRRCDQGVRRGAVSPAPTGLRRAQTRRRHLAGVAAHATTTSSPTTRRPSGSTRCTATTARIRSKAIGASSTPGPRYRMSRGSSRSSTISRPRATTRSTRLAGPSSMRRTATAARVSDAPGTTATRASSTRSPTPRSWPCDRRSPTTTSTLLVNAEVVRLETDASGRTVTDVVVSRDGGDGDVCRRHRGRVGRRLEQREDPARITERPPSERPRERLRPGRTQLHVPQQQGGRGAVERAERHALPEDPRRERLLLRRAGLRLPGRPDPDGRQVGRRVDEGRRAGAHQARPPLEPRRDRAALRRLLAHDGGPAQARQPRHARRRWQRPPVDTR